MRAGTPSTLHNLKLESFHIDQHDKLQNVQQNMPACRATGLIVSSHFHSWRCRRWLRTLGRKDHHTMIWINLWLSTHLNLRPCNNKRAFEATTKMYYTHSVWRAFFQQFKHHWSYFWSQSIALVASRPWFPLKSIKQYLKDAYGFTSPEVRKNCLLAVE